MVINSIYSKKSRKFLHDLLNAELKDSSYEPLKQEIDDAQNISNPQIIISESFK